jgi:hypothetical protein
MAEAAAAPPPPAAAAAAAALAVPQDILASCFCQQKLAKGGPNNSVKGYPRDIFMDNKRLATDTDSSRLFAAFPRVFAGFLTSPGMQKTLLAFAFFTWKLAKNVANGKQQTDEDVLKDTLKESRFKRVKYGNAFACGDVSDVRPSASEMEKVDLTDALWRYLHADVVREFALGDKSVQELGGIEFLTVCEWSRIPWVCGRLVPFLKCLVCPTCVDLGCKAFAGPLSRNFNLDPLNRNTENNSRGTLNYGKVFFTLSHYGISIGDFLRPRFQSEQKRGELISAAEKTIAPGRQFNADVSAVEGLLPLLAGHLKMHVFNKLYGADMNPNPEGSKQVAAGKRPADAAGLVESDRDAVRHRSAETLRSTLSELEETYPEAAAKVQVAKDCVDQIMGTVDS